MAVRIRLTRRGTKKKPFYRIVVADSAAPRDGRFIEVVGTYDPCKKPSEITVKMDKIEYWMSKGALPTAVVTNLIKRSSTQP